MTLKKMSLCVMVMTSLLGLSACGSDKSQEKASHSESKDGKVTISYAIWDSGQEPGIRKIADKFEEKILKSRSTFKWLPGIITGQCLKQELPEAPYQIPSGCIPMKSTDTVQMICS